MAATLLRNLSTRQNSVTSAGCWRSSDTHAWCGSACASLLQYRSTRSGAANRLFATQAETADILKVAQVVNDFRAHGHLLAELDPLHRVIAGPWQAEAGGTQTWTCRRLGRLLDIHTAGIDVGRRLAEEMGLKAVGSREYALSALLTAPPGVSSSRWSLDALIGHMRWSYCGTLAIEAAHVTNVTQRQWLFDRAEEPRDLQRGEALLVLELLAQSDALERFLADKYPSQKRFGIEGCEVLLPGLRSLAAECAASGVRRIEVAAPHRGRLNLLVTLLGKDPGALFAEMEGTQSEFHVGDVKYHTGQASTLSFDSSREGCKPQQVRISIAPNPSHLEAVSPVVLGMVRAEQTRRFLRSRTRTETIGPSNGGRANVMGLVLHGDAAFAGQGVVAETLQLANVPGFSIGGTIHVVINNQVGFTTAPGEARSSPHCTDIAKGLGVPVIHANADDPEAVVHACRVAAQWRSSFGKDVVIDICGYRRHGHNEMDDPRATMPLTYAAIDTHPRVLKLYSDTLSARFPQQPSEAGGKPSESIAELADRCHKESMERFQVKYEAARNGEYNISTLEHLESSWQGDALQMIGEGGCSDDSSEGPIQEPTGLPLPTLQWVGRAVASAPSDFNLHPSVKKLLNDRRNMVSDATSRVDWAMAEALAFGTLMLHRKAKPELKHLKHSHALPSAELARRLPASAEQPQDQQQGDVSQGLNFGHYGVRLCGQDSERGTFNQRHAAMYDQKSGERHVPLNNIQHGDQNYLEVFNTPLSEEAAAAFEYGFSLGSQGRVLSIWEAQFGDFANSAQVCIDQFIAAGEERWGQNSALVMMLPHGGEGQGPDHSSARLERFLQLANDDADSLPGQHPGQLQQMRSIYNALARENGGKLPQSTAAEVLEKCGGPCATERSTTLWQEMGLQAHEAVTSQVWERLMAQWLRRNAESSANLFVVNATTPAQLFHVLRRQMNRPYAKPLILATPKWLLHHGRATSALQDFTTGAFFNRVIDDGKASDNTRHLARHSVTGEAHLLPPDRIRRVLIVSGAIYYHLSRARQARRIRDVVLVRLEQIAPFPHDLVKRIISGYPNAEVKWCQEEPKNMGPWSYVKPRLETSLRQPCPSQASDDDAYSDVSVRKVQYIGRAASASPATASLAIHRAQLAEIISEALDSPESS